MFGNNTDITVIRRKGRGGRRRVAHIGARLRTRAGAVAALGVLTATALLVLANAAVPGIADLLLLGVLLLAFGVFLQVRLRFGGRAARARHRLFATATRLVIVGAASCGLVVQGRLHAHATAAGASTSRSSSSPIAPTYSSRLGRTISPFGLHPGDCFDAPGMREDESIDSADIVPCDGRHDGEAIFIGDIWPPATSYPGYRVLRRDSDRSARGNSRRTFTLRSRTRRLVIRICFRTLPNGKPVIGEWSASHTFQADRCSSRSGGGMRSTSGLFRPSAEQAAAPLGQGAPGLTATPRSEAVDGDHVDDGTARLVGGA